MRASRYPSGEPRARAAYQGRAGDETEKSWGRCFTPFPHLILTVPHSHFTDEKLKLREVRNLGRRMIVKQHRLDLNPQPISEQKL